MDRIRFDSVSKMFARKGGRKFLRAHLKELFGSRGAEGFYALRDVSFTVPAGTGLAVVGANGAGKSTLLNLATRLCYPDAGHVEVNGRLAAILDLGCGFHPDLTGAENLRVSASVFGLGRRRTRELFDPIVEFSGLGDFIHEPLSSYSAGMVARLAFSIVVQTDPEILLVDEVIAVGDQAFQAKCFERMMQFRRAGTTIVCVSHSPELLRQICDRGILLERGRLVASGRLEEVLAAYAERSPAPVHAGTKPGSSRAAG